MRTPGSAEELERRRRRAVELVHRGEKPADVCRILGVTARALQLWLKTVREQGPDALAAKPKLGTRRLDEGQLDHLVSELQKGSVAHGWANDLWTGTRVATLIQRLFGVEYTPDHVRVLLREALGWTSQKPERRGRERNEEEIERWRTEKFPRIKKAPGSAERTSSSSTKPASCSRRSLVGPLRHGEKRRSRNAGRATDAFR